MTTLAEGFPVVRPIHKSGVFKADKIEVGTIFEWPTGTFVENILTRTDGTIIVCIHSENKLVEVNPVDGTARTFCELPAAPSGILEVKGRIFVCVGTIGSANYAVFSVDDDGRGERWVDVPGALFLNGFAAMKSGVALAVDSILGKVFRIDLDDKTAATWLEDDLLKKASNEPMLPGVNGIKVHYGFAYLSNSEKSLFLKVGINEDDTAGKIQIIQEQLVGDDFVFDENGAMYIATHLHNTLMRLNPDGSREDLGGPDEQFAGSTACAFGKTERDKRTLYVTTTGGIIAPLNGSVGKARLLRLDVGVRAADETVRDADATPKKSLYEYAGGENAFRGFEERFYDKVLADPVLKMLFGERKPHHVEHLSWFTAESFGGPDRFTRNLGFQHIIDVHRHLNITDEQRERFVELYMESAKEAGLPADPAFQEALRSHVEFGARVAQQNSRAESDAELHPIRNVPHWDWPGPPDATS